MCHSKYFCFMPEHSWKKRELCLRHASHRHRRPGGWLETLLLLWMGEILHHLRNHESLYEMIPFPNVNTHKQSFHDGFPRGAKWILSIYSMFFVSPIANVDPGLINPCLFIWGCSPPKVLIPTKTRIGHPHINKQGLINLGSALPSLVQACGCIHNSFHGSCGSIHSLLRASTMQEIQESPGLVPTKPNTSNTVLFQMKQNN